MKLSKVMTKCEKGTKEQDRSSRDGKKQKVR